MQQEKGIISYRTELLHQDIATDAFVYKLYLLAALSDNIVLETLSLILEWLSMLRAWAIATVLPSM